MKNKELKAKMVEGFDPERFKRALSLEHRGGSAQCAAMFALLGAMDPAFQQFKPEEIICGSLIAGVNGLVVAGMTKEFILDTVQAQIDRAFEGKKQFIETLDNNPEGNHFSVVEKLEKEADAEASYSQPPLLAIKTDGKVH